MSRPARGQTLVAMSPYHVVQSKWEFSVASQKSSDLTYRDTPRIQYPTNICDL